MQRTKFTSIDQYILSSPKEVQPILKKLRDTFKQVIPKADKVISYNIPCFKIDRKYVVYFAGYSKHFSVYPIPKNIIGMKVDIQKHQAGKGTLHFDIEKPLPIDFIKKVVKQLAKEAAARGK